MTYRIDFTRKNNINDTQKEAVFMTTSEKGGSIWPPLKMLHRRRQCPKKRRRKVIPPASLTDRSDGLKLWVTPVLPYRTCGKGSPESASLTGIAENTSDTALLSSGVWQRTLHPLSLGAPGSHGIRKQDWGKKHESQFPDSLKPEFPVEC